MEPPSLPTEVPSSSSSSSSLTSYIIFIVLDFLHTMLNGYLTAFFVVTGVISNLFSIYIFVHCERTKMSAIQYYLVTLLVWQTSLLVNAFLLYSLPLLLFHGDQSIQGNYVYIYPYVYTFANTTHTGSVWVVLTLTIDRYLALCQPLKHRALGKRSRVRKLMIAVSLMATLFSTPRFFEVYVREEYDDTLNATFALVDRTSLFENRVYWSAYHVILATLFVTLCPCLLLFALTVRISFALRAAIAKRKSLCQPALDVDSRNRKPNFTRKEHKSNIMLVLVIAKFLISDILPTIVDVLEHLVGANEFMASQWASLFVDLSNFLLVLNCSSNFWVFLVWGKRFRQSCRRLLVSTSLGMALYKAVNRSEPDLVSMCGPSSFTTAYLTTKNGERTTTISRRNIKASSFRDSPMLVRYPTVNGTSSGSGGQRTKGGVADMDQDHLLAQLERQSLIVSPSPLHSSVIRPFSTLHTQLV
ncbi:frpr-7 [Pristionchus pacificus]|uniref:Frpr-7 n=1 Tax=Pristionchus pacificus TaxID=54126 RepID=A0A2A6BGF1_PRIPA|nr:frpr-7 [Pristionchus pacificus]|eukprot:PDM64891.1 frpr-7 [Pristionchus pacificus]